MCLFSLQVGPLLGVALMHRNAEFKIEFTTHGGAALTRTFTIVPDKTSVSYAKLFNCHIILHLNMFPTCSLFVKPAQTGADASTTHRAVCSLDLNMTVQFHAHVVAYEHTSLDGAAGFPA